MSKTSLTPQQHTEAVDRDPREQASEDGQSRMPYAAPRLVDDLSVDDLLEILGPAQAAYGGAGTSDRGLKTDVTDIDPEAVLEGVAELPISQWRYLVEDEGVKHMGPMAQDFSAVFGLGSTDKRIGSIDANGVALAAIQALSKQVRQLEARIAELEG